MHMEMIHLNLGTGFAAFLLVLSALSISPLGWVYIKGFLKYHGIGDIGCIPTIIGSILLAITLLGCAGIILSLSNPEWMKYQSAWLGEFTRLNFGIEPCDGTFIKCSPWNK